jgi:hypothetical protein
MWGMGGEARSGLGSVFIEESPAGAVRRRRMARVLIANGMISDRD